jgi:hypothetical protein
MNVSMANALLADAADMTRFLSPIPNGDRLGKILENGKPMSSRAYDDDTWTARFVASDGVSVKCFTVSDVTIDQAEMIASVSLDFSSWQEADFRDMVQRVLAAAPDPPR